MSKQKIIAWKWNSRKSLCCTVATMNDAMKLSVRDRQKARLGPILNLRVYSKFQFLNLIWRRVKGEINSKKKENRSKNYIFEYLRDAVRLKSLPPPPLYLGSLLNAHIKFKLFSSIWMEVIRGKTSMNKKNLPKNLIFGAI